MFTPLADPVRPAKIGQVVLGPAPVKILASLMPADTEELLTDAEHMAETPVDVFEWRADYFQMQKAENYIQSGVALQSMVAKPVLWTLRSDREGGLYKGSDEQYVELVGKIAQSALFDAIDIEVERAGVDILTPMVENARKGDTCVVMSYHNFDETPTIEAIMKKFAKMAECGADVFKVALMPQKPEDVLNLMQATLEARRKYDVPVIAMSMGPAGQVTRMLGSLYGSCATFASLQQASAPGQINVKTLTGYLKDFAV